MKGDAMSEMKYSDKQLEAILNAIKNDRMIISEKYQELLRFAIAGDDDAVTKKIIGNAVRRKLKSQPKSDDEAINPAPLFIRELRHDLEVGPQSTEKYAITFGITTIDGNKYMPESLDIDGLSFHRVQWGDVRKALESNGQVDTFMNIFARTVNLNDLFAFQEDRRITFTSTEFYELLEGRLARHLYYEVEVEAMDVEVATNLAERSFNKVLQAAAAAYALTTQGTTWNRDGALTRRAPAMFNGVFQAINLGTKEFLLLEARDKVVKAEQRLLDGTQDMQKYDETRVKNFKRILEILQECDDNIVYERLNAGTRILQDALSSDDPHNRHLGLWQCIEASVGWKWRKEKDIVKTIKNYYDPSNEANEIWRIVGDYVHAKRCEYVHEGAKISWDSHGTYDSALNLYMDYVRVALAILVYVCGNLGLLGIGGEEDFEEFMDWYAKSEGRIDVGEWVKKRKKH